ncbi:MAG: toast rack family protein [Chloroflexi bacterium]|nr:toast rack family protein [Chloroflexota bacterium]
MSKEKRKVEWSFDFESMGDRVSQFFSDMIGDDVEVETANLITPGNGAESASVEIDFSVGRASLNALAPDSDNLFEAEINYVGEYEFEVKGAAQRSIKLRQKGQFPKGIGRVIGNNKDLHWDIALAQNIPYQLSMKGGVGETDIDLSHLLVDDIRLETGIGKIAVTLPTQDASIAAKVSGGVGKTDIVIPDGSYGKLDIDGGVGEVIVTLSPEAAVQLNATAGLGKVDLPESFKQVKGTGHVIGVDGIWETANFKEADKRITIDFDGGIGSFQLQFFDVL